MSQKLIYKFHYEMQYKINFVLEVQMELYDASK